MWAAAKLFFSTDLGKGLLILVGIILVVLAAFWAGHSQGYSSGHDEGFKAGYASRNQEVTDLKADKAALVKTINDDRKAQSTKIKDVETTAANAALKTEQQFNKKLRERDRIISDYEKSVPTAIQEKCGLDVETVRAINKLIDNVNGVQDETPNPTPSATPGSGGLDVPGSGMRQPGSTQADGGRSADPEGREGSDPTADAGSVPSAGQAGGTFVHAEGEPDRNQQTDYALQ